MPSYTRISDHHQTRGPYGYFGQYMQKRKPPLQPSIVWRCRKKGRREDKALQKKKTYEYIKNLLSSLKAGRQSSFVDATPLAKSPCYPSSHHDTNRQIQENG